jgi:hypothetical protein
MQNIPHVTCSIPQWVQIFSYMLLPLNIFWVSFLTVVCLPKEDNGLKNPKIS